jgi:hypothetical protein
MFGGERLPRELFDEIVSITFKDSYYWCSDMSAPSIYMVNKRSYKRNIENIKNVKLGICDCHEFKGHCWDCVAHTLWCDNLQCLVEGYKWGGCGDRCYCCTIDCPRHGYRKMIDYDRHYWKKQDVHNELMRYFNPHDDEDHFEKIVNWLSKNDN